MGERANVVLRFDADHDPLYLYAHWGAEDLAEVVRKALARRQRWGDSSYLARIIARDVFNVFGPDETGAGLSPYECDNEYPKLWVDLEHSTVSHDGAERFAGIPAKETITFEQFVTGSP